MKRINLDDVSQLQAHDAADMLGAIYKLPEQMELALDLMKRTAVSLDRSRVKTILITGLGGSAVGGDLLRTYVGDTCPVPILVNRGYTMPSYVGDDTWVIAISYSGNTEETLSAYEEAKARGAQLTAITSGGELAERARRDGVPLVSVPSGLQPRAAVGHLFVPLLSLVQKSGLVAERVEEMEETLQLLRDMRDELAPTAQTAHNLAKQIALRLHGKIPLIHSSTGLTEAIAYRWKTQINENAQTLAFAHSYPELNHNEIVGFDVPSELIERVEVIALSSTFDHPRVQKRISITMSEVLADARCGRSQLAARGESALAQMFSLLLIGDYASAYLAVLYGLDPTPVVKIEQLKKRLAD
ncbi:bifunctional phosphoglucose/phosphomannose isomerase [Tumebacillus lipolyticus]|uniref:Bifunctional phosphoglucose/phosphomannose isomerase n=1 Tax=Tumebacillus lipolyticus TaxID=1280370 RepID=A0ABW5A298_9BACL